VYKTGRKIGQNPENEENRCKYREVKGSFFAIQPQNGIIAAMQGGFFDKIPTK